MCAFVVVYYFIFFVLCDAILSDNLDGICLSRHRICTVGHTSCLLCITQWSLRLAWPCICCAAEDKICNILSCLCYRVDQPVTVSWYTRTSNVFFSYFVFSILENPLCIQFQDCIIQGGLRRRHSSPYCCWSLC